MANLVCADDLRGGIAFYRPSDTGQGVRYTWVGVRGRHVRRTRERAAESTEGSRGSPQIMASFFIVQRSVVIVDDRGCRELFLTVEAKRKHIFLDASVAFVTR